MSEPAGRNGDEPVGAGTRTLLPGFAFLLLGASHLLALAVPILVVVVRIQIGGEPRPSDAALAFVVLLWWSGWVTGGSASVAQRLGADRARGVTAAAAFMAGFLLTGVIGVLAAAAGLVPQGLRPPIMGVGLGLQLLVLLTPRTRAASAWRVGLPVVADLLAAALPGPGAVDQISWQFVAGPLWLALALWAVLRLERRLAPPPSPP